MHRHLGVAQILTALACRAIRQHHRLHGRHQGCTSLRAKLGLRRRYRLGKMALQRLLRIVGAVELRQRRIGPTAAIRRLSVGQRACSIPANLFQHGQDIRLIQPQ